MSMAPDLEEENAALRECLRERTAERDRLRAALMEIAKGDTLFSPRAIATVALKLG